MLTVKTYLKQSPVEGIGLYAGQTIKKGEVIWEYFPLVDITYSPDEWLALLEKVNKHSLEFLKRYAYKENGIYIVCMDNAQFMNHSDEHFNLTNTSDLKSMYATRDIEENEELLCNYFEYSDEDDHHRIFLVSRQ